MNHKLRVFLSAIILIYHYSKYQTEELESILINDNNEYEVSCVVVNGEGKSFIMSIKGDVDAINKEARYYLENLIREFVINNETHDYFFSCDILGGNKDMLSRCKTISNCKKSGEECINFINGLKISRDNDDLNKLLDEVYNKLLSAQDTKTGDTSNIYGPVKDVEKYSVPEKDELKKIFADRYALFYKYQSEREN